MIHFCTKKKLEKEAISYYAENQCSLSQSAKEETLETLAFGAGPNAVGDAG